MPGPRQTITDIIRQQQRWLCEQNRWWASVSMPVANAGANKTGDTHGGLTEIAGFGSNPGALRMLVHLPESLPPSAPLVVVLHGCTQSAADFGRAGGWSDLASQFGFALLFPEQRRVNNSKDCFNWFAANDTRRGAGEALSIRQMIDWMLANHDLAPERVYVTGLSAGGSMAAVMLATYPEIFAGGAIIGGLPYGQCDGRPPGPPGYGWKAEGSCRRMGRRGPRRLATPRSLAPGLDLAR